QSSQHSTEIELQRQLLEKLEKDKSLFQRELNGLLNPVTRLPFDLSSAIFLRTLPFYPRPGVNNVPLLFLHVCSAWRDIALSTPALWANIQMIDAPRGPGFEEGLQTWFRRAGDHFLSIS
ncbi:hypothetical protein DFH06DRAFT_956473, partial [Mycena polygramma]